MTISILSATSELSLAATSTCHPGVGGIVPVAGRSGSVASQASGSRDIALHTMSGLDLGLSPTEAVSRALEGDTHRGSRQVMAAGRDGESFGYTGDEVLPHFGTAKIRTGIIGGNMLELEALEAAEDSLKGSADQPVPAALEALRAAFKAGGDARGNISSALAACGTIQHHGIDLGVDDLTVRIDWAEDPVEALHRAVNQKLSYLVVDKLADTSENLPDHLDSVEAFADLCWSMLGTDPDGSAAVLVCRKVLADRMGHVEEGFQLSRELVINRPGPGCNRRTLGLLWA